MSIVLINVGWCCRFGVIGFIRIEPKFVRKYKEGAAFFGQVEESGGGIENYQVSFYLIFFYEIFIDYFVKNTNISYFQ